MPTIDDLRAAFDVLEEQAPAAVRVPPAQRSSRRHWPAVGLAAAVTAAVAVGVPLASSGGGDGPTTRPSAAVSAPATQRVVPPAFGAALPAPAAGTSPVLRVGFGVSPVPGYALGDQLPGTTPAPVEFTISRTDQRVDIGSTDARVRGSVQVYYAGAFDAGTLDHGHPVDVGGRPGYYARIRLGVDDPTRYDVLAWEYAPGAWAVVSLYDHVAGSSLLLGRQGPGRRYAHDPGLPVLQADQLRIATATHAATAVIRVPFRITDRHLHVVSLSPSSLELRDDHAGRTWSVQYTAGGLSPRGAPTTIAGRTWDVVTDGTTVKGAALIEPGFGTIVDTTESDISEADLEAFITGMHFVAHPHRPATWLDAAAALP